MTVAIENFEVVPEAEQPQRSTSTQSSGGGAAVPPAKLAKQIEDTLRIRDARRARLRAT